MTDAERERAAVVAWLRAESDRRFEQASAAGNARPHSKLNGEIRGAQLAYAADMILACSHLKDPHP